MKEKVSTTVKIEPNHYKEFKILGIRSGLTLQDFVERCLTLYVSESSFRSVVDVRPPTVESTITPTQS